MRCSISYTLNELLMLKVAILTVFALSLPELKWCSAENPNDSSEVNECVEPESALFASEVCCRFFKKFDCNS